MSQQVWGSFTVSGEIRFPLIREYKHLFPISLPDWPNLPKCLKLPQVDHSSMLDSINTPLPRTERAGKSQYHIWFLLRYLAIHLQPLAMKLVVQGFLQPCCSLLMRSLFVHKCRWMTSQHLTVLNLYYFLYFPLLQKLYLWIPVVTSSLKARVQFQEHKFNLCAHVSNRNTKKNQHQG